VEGEEPVDKSPNEWQPPTATLERRSLGICILLYIFTFGIYPVLWWYMVHSELPSRKGKDNSPGVVAAGFASVLAVAYVTTTWLLVTMLDLAFSHDGPPEIEAMSTLEVYLSAGMPMLVISIASTVFSAYWLFRIGTRLTDRVNTLADIDHVVTGRPSRALISWAAGLSLASVGLSFLDHMIPFAGLVIWAGSFILNVIWWVQIQETMNVLADINTQRQANAYHHNPRQPTEPLR